MTDVKNSRGHKTAGAMDADTRREFMRALIGDLHALERMIDNDMFERGVQRIGAEQEIFLVDRARHPIGGALQILDKIDDPHFTTELGLFNLEINIDPQPAAGQGLARIEQQLTTLYAKLQKTAEELEMEPVLAGILPTLNKTDLGIHNMAPKPRYHALNEAMNAERGAAYDFSIRGLDELEMRHDTVMVEACNASFQTHLQIAQPERFTAYYNLAQALVAPILAAATNSPVLFGRRLWAETRIALFEQSCDIRTPGLHLREQMGRVSLGRDWVRGSVVDIFKEAISRFRALVTSSGHTDSMKELEEGRIPILRALKLHSGTIYRWNRACYDVSPSGKPHLRIEQRVLPSGPTIPDEIASMAFWLGLMIELGHSFDDVANHMAFDDARANLYAAARDGLASRLTWLDGKTHIAQPLILDELLPLSQAGLDRVGMLGSDSRRYLGIVEQRVRSLKTGSRWALNSLAAMQGQGSSGARSTALVEAMIVRQKSGKPVSEWPLAELSEHDATRSRTHKVSQFMTTDIFSVRFDEPVRLAAEIIEWEKLRHLAVEDEKSRLVGLLTARSIRRHLEKHPLEEGGGDVPVSELMQRDLVTVTPDTLTLDAIALAKKKKIGVLPVVQDGHLVAMLDEHHLLKFAANVVEQERAQGDK